ncbi:hypothetical protein SCALM49S_08868 [Streptomyces californicus]
MPMVNGRTTSRSGGSTACGCQLTESTAREGRGSCGLTETDSRRSAPCAEADARSASSRSGSPAALGGPPTAGLGRPGPDARIAPMRTESSAPPRAGAHIAGNRMRMYAGRVNGARVADLRVLTSPGSGGPWPRAGGGASAPRRRGRSAGCGRGRAAGPGPGRSGPSGRRPSRTGGCGGRRRRRAGRSRRPVLQAAAGQLHRPARAPLRARMSAYRRKERLPRGLPRSVSSVSRSSSSGSVSAEASSVMARW